MSFRKISHVLSTDADIVNPEEIEGHPPEEDDASSVEELVDVCAPEVPADIPNTEETVELPNVAEPASAPSAEEPPPITPELDPNILAALGEIVDESPDFGEKIHDSLAKIWTPLLKKGLLKENRDKLLKDYLIPENCPLLKSPTLNPEIMAAIPETGRFRDKKICSSQNQLGVGISAINRGLNTLLTSDKKIEAIKCISDGCRLLSDLHHQQTETRKKFITPCLDKGFLQLIQVAERDDTLYGNNLSEKIKASKAITTQSQQIKKNTVTPKPSVAQTVTRANSQGNWQGPPRFSQNRGGRGGYKRTNPRGQQTSTQTSQAQSQPKPYQQTKTRGTSRQPHHQT
ncbi:uncharacterized protein LOC114354545 [Ostrinia furnacalis]|uniref:uncharacterized protein LOC114354545 n=1 Tax=Ostrinia furnacalis TaxID=93504 RepID=UPI00103E783B|nr:uncharacterized protein LOC114354545 [Ostrinia furnacalis]